MMSNCPLSVADPENFGGGGGGFEAKTSKIRMSSPKLRLKFKRFFRPKSGGLQKIKKKKKGLNQN